MIKEEIEKLAEEFVFTVQLEGDDAETAKLAFMDGYTAAQSKEVQAFKEKSKRKLYVIAENLQWSMSDEDKYRAAGIRQAHDLIDKL